MISHDVFRLLGPKEVRYHYKKKGFDKLLYDTK